MMNIERVIEQFLCKMLRVDFINPTENLFEKGRGTSLFTMQLILFLEKSFNFKITREDLKKENFENYNAIVNFVVKKNKEEL